MINTVLNPGCKYLETTVQLTTDTRLGKQRRMTTMSTNYICNECDLVWGKNEKNQFMHVCPNCRSYNIQILDQNSMAPGHSDNNDLILSNRKHKIPISEYIVPWMIDI